MELKIIPRQYAHGLGKKTQDGVIIETFNGKQSHVDPWKSKILPDYITGINIQQYSGSL